MRPKRMVLTVDGATPVYPCNHYASNSTITVEVNLLGTGTYGVEYTLDDVYAKGFDPATAKWYPHATLTALSADAAGTFTFRPTGIRMTGATVAGGGARMTIIENGGGS